MKYPVKCKGCNEPLYGPVKYCPFCGVASDSAADARGKENLSTLRKEINSSLIQGYYSAAVRGNIRRKGKELGIDEKACDSLLLAALTEKKFNPEREMADDPLSVCWYSAEKSNPKDVEHQQLESTAIEEADSDQEKPENVMLQSSSAPEDITISDPLPPPKPLFWRVVLVVGIVGILGGLFYTKKGSVESPVSKTEQKAMKSKYKVARTKKSKKSVVELPKSQIEQRNSLQPAIVPNPDAEREKIKQEVEKEAQANVEVQRQQQDQINRQREIENQRQEQATRQRDIDDYLAAGRRFFDKGKYELCIEKMNEVLRKDRNNYDAERYIQMARNKLDQIEREFEKPNVGRTR